MNSNPGFFNSRMASANALCSGDVSVCFFDDSHDLKLADSLKCRNWFCRFFRMGLLNAIVTKRLMKTIEHVAFLRGINVGGNNMLPMTDLVEMFAAAKCGEVRSHIQSGNVIFEATPKIAARLPEIISAQIEKGFGHRIPVVLRGGQQLRQIVAKNPFLKAGTAPETLHVMFLADTPSPDKIIGLDPNRSPPGQFAVCDQEIYLMLPTGVAKTKLTNAYFDSKLTTTSTQRN